MALTQERFEAARQKAIRGLLEARLPAGHWEGQLSSSALSTATAVTALTLMRKQAGSDDALYGKAVNAGLRWLAENVNADGGWGDTVLSLSNISTTTLCWAALGAVTGAPQQYAATVKGAERWLAGQAGSASPEHLAPAIVRRYGEDRTFSVPILTMCALAGRLGPGPEAWRWVKPLPFELAACPHQWFAALRLPVVSYALPALVAMGYARHVHLPSANPLTRMVRHLAKGKALRVLEAIQPVSGGFLEATPLTSFVTMSLAGSGLASHPVARRGLAFLISSQLPDGSWPIDTNLATWLTTLSVNALGDHLPSSLPEGDQPAAAAGEPQVSRLAGAVIPGGSAILGWLLRQQYRHEHPYTHASPGGWAWTDLSGGVPDADDTAGALLALHILRHEVSAGPPRPEGAGPTDLMECVANGVRWLLNLQNRDGGIPTFCKGWGRLPFDRSSADITAHAVRAWVTWRAELDTPLAAQVDGTISKALAYLARSQREDGAWAPLWFGNQHAPHEENLTYGTAKVLRALAVVAGNPLWREVCQCGTKAAAWLLQAQQADGSWGGSPQTPSSIEETSLSIEALAAYARSSLPGPNASLQARRAIERGLEWLVPRIESDQWVRPSPIGFYFAKLWYFERLYPMIFTVDAMNEARRLPACSAAAS